MKEEIEFTYYAMIYSIDEEHLYILLSKKEGYLIYVPTNSGFRRGDHVRVKLKKPVVKYKEEFALVTKDGKYEVHSAKVTFSKKKGKV